MVRCGAVWREGCSGVGVSASGFSESGCGKEHNNDTTQFWCYD